MARVSLAGRVATALVAVVLAATGCLNPGLDLDELPDSPIAVTYWEPEPARRRHELLNPPEQRGPTRTGVAQVEDIGSMLTGRSRPEGGSAEAFRRYPGHLSLVSPRTGEVTRVHAAPPGAVPVSWSDDRRRLLFLSGHRGGVHIYEYDLDRDEVRSITRGQLRHISADYGARAQVAVLQLSPPPAGTSTIFVTDENGVRPEPVVEAQTLDSPRLSPDGARLVYVRHPAAGPSGRIPPRQEQVVVRNLRDGSEKVLARGRQPSFSPDGEWIVYSAPAGTGWRLRRVRVDGSARAAMGPGLRDEKAPAVSPDGRFVAYMAVESQLEWLWVRRIDGSGDRVLLDTGAVLSPVW